MAECINLLQSFGKLYKIRFDPAYDPKGIRRKNLDPWHMQIPCKFGAIYPHGGYMLAVEVDYHPGIAKKINQLPGAQLWQDGSHEKTYLFPLELLGSVAEIVKPMKRRQVNEEEKQRLAKIGAAALATIRAKNWVKFASKNPQATQSPFEQSGEV